MSKQLNIYMQFAGTVRYEGGGQKMKHSQSLFVGIVECERGGETMKHTVSSFVGVGEDGRSCVYTDIYAQFV